jgi:hypothetical protein
MMNGVRGLADNGRKAISGLLDAIASLQPAGLAIEVFHWLLTHLRNCSTLVLLAQIGSIA